MIAQIGREFPGPTAFALQSVTTLPLWLAAAGVLCAWHFVLRRPDQAEMVQQRAAWLYRLLVNKYYFDWFNENVIARAGRGLGLVLWHGGDQAVIDNTLVNGSAGAIAWFAGRARLMQSGFLYSYAFWMIVGLVLLLGWFLVRV